MSDGQPKKWWIERFADVLYDWRRTLIPVLFVAVVFCHSVTTVYHAVMDEVPRTSSGKDQYCTPRGFAVWPADHLIRDGKLYLRTMSVRNLMLMNGLIPDEWDEKRVVAFRAAHPELEDYWREPSRRDGGVRWPGRGK